LWKFVKKKCLYNVYYETFEQFKGGINDCLEQIDQQYKEEEAILMNLEFQNFKNYKILLA
ncbi:MAG: IS630 family transposase, partial [Planctomycetaceae bacterium]|nr:IS630 family transposase [Planctomycetaceae bacterium]